MNILSKATKALRSGTTSLCSLALLLVGVVVIPTPVQAEPFAYVANPGGSTPFFPNSPVSVIDTATNTIVATVVVGNSPVGVAITPDGTHAFVANRFSNNVSVIDTVTNAVVATIGVRTGPWGIAINSCFKPVPSCICWFGSTT